MIVNMYSVVEKDSKDFNSIVSFKSKIIAEKHAQLLNMNSQNNYIVVPSKVNLLPTASQLGAEQ